MINIIFSPLWDFVAPATVYQRRSVLLQTRGSVALLTIAILVSTTLFYIAEPIYCQPTSNKLTPTFATKMCLSTASTIFHFRIPKDESPKTICEENDQPQVHTPIEDEKVLSRFFLWIPFNCLLTCGIMMLGYGITRFFDGQSMDLLLKDLKAGEISKTAKCLQTSKRMCQKRVLISFGSDLLTLVSSIILIVVMNNLTNGQLGSLRQEGLSFIWETNFERSDGLQELIPAIYSCSWPTFGLTGKIDKDSAVCINSHSLLFECFFVGFWIWMTFSTTIMGLDFLYHKILLLDFTFDMITTKKETIDVMYKELGLLHAIGLQLSLDVLESNIHPLDYEKLIVELNKE